MTAPFSSRLLAAFARFASLEDSSSAFLELLRGSPRDIWVPLFAQALTSPDERYRLRFSLFALADVVKLLLSAGGGDTGIDALVAAIWTPTRASQSRRATGGVPSELVAHNLTLEEDLLAVDMVEEDDEGNEVAETRGPAGHYRGGASGAAGQPAVSKAGKGGKREARSAPQPRNAFCAANGPTDRTAYGWRRQ